MDAPLEATAEDVRSRAGRGVFRTRENAVAAEWHKWETNYLAPQGGQDWRATGLECLTTILVEGD